MILTHPLMLSCHSHAPYVLQVLLMRVQGKWVIVAVSDKEITLDISRIHRIYYVNLVAS